MKNTEKQHKTIQGLTQENNNLKAENLYLKVELERIRQLISGKKTERFEAQPDTQLKLDLFPEIVEKQDDTEETEILKYERKKPKKTKKIPVRNPIPEHLPRVTEIVEPKNLPEGAVKMKILITEVLEYKPGRIFVRQIIRPQYVVPNPIKTTDFDADNVILAAELPTSLPILGSNASASLLAHIAVSKLVDHLPLYRQIQMFKRQGIEFASSTVNDWFKNTCILLTPLYDALIKETLKSSYVQVDESPMPVLTKDKPCSTHKGYMWVYYSPPNNLVFFDYDKSRGKEPPKKILENYSGTIQTDGYAAYKQFEKNPDICLAACGAHARRKFYESQKENLVVCNFVLAMFQKIYAIEKVIRENQLSPEEILEIRTRESAPIMDELEKYLQEKQDETLPKSQTGKAIAYTLNLWDRLKVFLHDPAVLFDNNLIENSIRPLALGRKNYLFAGSHEAAQRIAMMYSFFATCKRRDIEPFNWLKTTLEKISAHKANRLYELLPGYKPKSKQ